VAKTTQQRRAEDRLWELIEPRIPSRPAPRGPGGRPRIDDRAALEWILFVLDTGCRWRDLPEQLGCGCGHTAWRRLSAANTHDSMLFEPLLDTNPTVRGHHGRAGRPRCRPDRLHADKGYDYRRYLTRRGIKARIARRGIEGKSASAGSAGSSNAPSPGCCGSHASGCATTGPNAPRWRYSRWPAP
jgi:Putative transposase of IS4/5 family (DUF4096)